MARGHRQPSRRRPPQSRQQVVQLRDGRHAVASGRGFVLLGLFPPAQHAQRAADQSLHLVLAGVGRHAAAERGHGAFQIGHQPFAARHAAGQQHAIDGRPVERRQQSGDGFGDLVDHRLVDGGGLGVACIQPALHFAEIRRAQQVQQAAAALVQLQELLQRVAAAEAQADQFAGRLAARALRAERTLAVQAVVHVDVAALGVGADRDAAAHVADDQVQVLVERLVLARIAARGGDLVERMADDLAPDRLHARDLHALGGLVHHHRVDDESRLARPLDQLAGDQRAQVRRVIRSVPGQQVVAHPVVHVVGAVRDRPEQATATGHGVQVVHRQPVFGQGAQHQVLAHGVLLDDPLAFERMQFGRGVLDLGRERLDIPFVQGDLRAGRAGVDGQDPVPREERVLGRAQPVAEPVQAQGRCLDRQRGVGGGAVHGQVHALEPQAEHDAELAGLGVAGGVQVEQQIAGVKVRHDQHVRTADEAGLLAAAVQVRGAARKRHADLHLALDVDRAVARAQRGAFGQDLRHHPGGAGARVRARALRPNPCSSTTPWRR